MELKNLTLEDIRKLDTEGKKALFESKKSQIKYTDTILSTPLLRAKESTLPTQDEVKKKDSLDVTIVCNTAWFCDSHMDVLTADSYNNSVKARGTTVPHIADHRQSSTSHVGDVTALYTKEMSLKDLGLEQEGKTTALIMESTVRKDYNEDVFKFYANGKINQHSIGLRYVKIYLAYDSSDPDEAAYKDVWDKYYPSIINKEEVDKRGYFWAVTEIDLMENSCVLFGANALTPTLEVKSLFPVDGLEKPTEVIKKEPLTTTKGIYMTLEEALLENVSLKAQVDSAKAATVLAVAKATQDERNRALGILEAANTFKLKPDLAVKRIKSNTTVEDAVSMFEDIAESVTKGNPLDTTDGVLPSVTKTTVGEEQDFHSVLGEAFKKVDSIQPLFKDMK
jgi:hypothetical protein